MAWRNSDCPLNSFISLQHDFHCLYHDQTPSLESWQCFDRHSFSWGSQLYCRLADILASRIFLSTMDSDRHHRSVRCDGNCLLAYIENSRKGDLHPKPACCGLNKRVPPQKRDSSFASHYT